MNITEFTKTLKSGNCSFLLGNGFSMNFDSGFCSIHDRLYQTNKALINKTKYRVSSPNKAFEKKLNENYDSVLYEVKYIIPQDFHRIFDDGIAFAGTIVNCDKMEQFLRDKKLVTNLTFGLSQWNSLINLYQIGKMFGPAKVNIEYWTILKCL